MATIRHRAVLAVTVLALSLAIEAVALSAPSIHWHSQIEAPVGIAPVLGVGRLVVADRTGQVHALSTETGEFLWQVRPQQEEAHPGTLALSGDRVFATIGDEVLALHVEDGRTLWRHPFRQRPWLFPATAPMQVIPGGLVVTDTLGTRTFSREGVEMWHRPEKTAAVTIAADTLFLCDGPNLRALSLSDGAVLWDATFGADLPRSLVVHGGLVFVTGFGSDTIAAYRRHDGAAVWVQNFELEDWLDIVAVGGGRLFVHENRNSTSNSSEIGRLIILSTTTGELLHRASEGRNIRPSSFLHDDRLVLARSAGTESLRGSVSAVDVDGGQLWSFLMPRAAVVEVALATTGDSVLFAADGSGGTYGTGTSHVRALTLAQGEELWRLEVIGDRVHTLVGDSALYAVTDYGHVYAICPNCVSELGAVGLTAPGLAAEGEARFRLRMSAGGKITIDVHPADDVTGALPQDVTVEAAALHGLSAPAGAPGQLRYLAPADAAMDSLWIQIRQVSTGIDQRLAVRVVLDPVRDDRLRWRASTPGEAIHVFGDTDRVYVVDRERTDAAANPGSSGLTAFDPATGRRLWQRRLAEGVPQVRLAEGHVYAGLVDSLFAIDTASGAIDWRQRVGRGPAMPVVGEQLVYVSTGDSITAVSRQTGQRQWAVNTGDIADMSHSRLRLHDGLLLADGNDDPLLAFDAVSGELRWRAMHASGTLYNGPVAHSGLVFGVDQERGQVFALTADQGLPRWTVYATVADPKFLHVVGDTLLYGKAGHLVALSTANGRILWDVADPNFDYLPPGNGGGLLFMRTPAGFPAAFSRAGEPIWEHPDEPGFSYFSFARRALFMVLPSRSGGKQVRALDAATGQERWRYAVPSDQDMNGTLYVGPVADMLYFGTNNGSVFALTTGIETAVLGPLSSSLPRQLRLGDSYPNPANPSVTIPFDLPLTTEVHLSVYDVLGQRVRSLARGDHAAGSYLATWDGTDASGHPVASGVYIYELWTPTERITGTLAIVR